MDATTRAQDLPPNSSGEAWWTKRPVDVGFAIVVAVIAALLIYKVPNHYLDTLADHYVKLWQPDLRPRSAALAGLDFYNCADVAGSSPRPSSGQAAAPTRPSASAPLVPVASTAAVCREFLASEQAYVISVQSRILEYSKIQMDMSIAFVRFQYYATLAALIAGALTTGALLAVSFQGWGKSPLWTKFLFIEASVTAAFWLAVPQVYKYEDNLAAALRRYNTAFSTGEQIGVVRATGRSPDGKWVVPSEFVSTLSTKVAEANGYLVAIDQTKALFQRIDAPK